MAVTRKFQVEMLRDREVTEHTYTFQENEVGVKSRVLKQNVRVVPESYMVYFPAGHSVWVETKAELARLALLPGDNIEIDTETGLPVTPPDVPNIKAMVERKTANTRNSING